MKKFTRRKPPKLDNAKPKAAPEPPMPVKVTKPVKKLPSVPIKQQILAVCDTLEPLENIHVKSPELTENISSPKKRAFIVDSLELPEQTTNENLLDNSLGLKYLRDDNPNLQEQEDNGSKSLYPSILELANRRKQHNISTTEITNVTLTYLQPTRSGYKDELPNFNKFARKAKRFSQIADARIQNIGRHRHTRSEIISSDVNASVEQYLSTLPPTIKVSATMLQQQQTQAFIKYHIVSFSQDNLTLTTNPGTKHTYCKYGLAYNVDIQHPKVSDERFLFLHSNPDTKPLDYGFRLVISEKYSLGKPAIVVTKRSALKGNGYTIWLLKRTILNAKNQYDTLDETDEDYWQGDLDPLPFAQAFKNNSLYEEITRSDTKRIMNRYQAKDFENDNWWVGSIPKMKHNNILKFKNYSRDILEGGELESHSTKILHKYNVYFFTNQDRRLKVRLPEGKQKYATNENQVLAMFRPHEINARKKFVKDIKRLKNKNNEKFYINNEYNYNSIDNVDEPKKEVTYFQPGDGIIDKNTPDDDPSDYKLGWLTIYNEPCLSSPGMFEFVLGLTLAVSYERIINMR